MVKVGEYSCIVKQNNEWNVPLDLSGSRRIKTPSGSLSPGSISVSLISESWVSDFAFGRSLLLLQKSQKKFPRIYNEIIYSLITAVIWIPDDKTSDSTFRSKILMHKFNENFITILHLGRFKVKYFNKNELQKWFLYWQFYWCMILNVTLVNSNSIYIKICHNKEKHSCSN